MTYPATASQEEINVSATFFPSAILPGTFGDGPDLLLCSSDLSFFYVHKSILTAKSSNSFGYKLPSSFPRDSGSYPPASSRTSSIYYPEYYSDSNPSASPASLFEPSPPFVSAASQVTPSGGWQSRDDVYGYGLSGYTSSKPTSSGSQWDLDQLCGGVMMPTMSAEPPSSFRICVEETSTVLNLVLHLIYGMSFASFLPDIDTVARALDSLRRYGIPVPTDPQAEIWSSLLRQAHLDPIRVYSVAAAHGASPVCVLASQYTLTESLGSVSEGDASAMGPIYLRLLFRLHIGRQEALGRVIKTPPKEHLPSTTCSIPAQRFVANAWTLMVGSILSGPRVYNTSAAELREAFGALVQKNTCELCNDAARARISEMTRAWLAIRRTI